MGVREARFGTTPLITSSAKNLWRQFPACWMAGVAVAMLAGTGALVRLILAGDVPACLAWTAGALWIPSLALALGVWTGSSRAFEGLYTVLWYIGPDESYARAGLHRQRERKRASAVRNLISWTGDPSGRYGSDGTETAECLNRFRIPRRLDS